jgi:transcription antitermination factor NusG
MTQTIRWFIILTRAAAEWQAHRELLQAGMRCYYPYYYANVRRGRWYQGAIKPQFPGYLFVGLEPGESIEAARRVNGVHDFLRNRGGLVALSDDQMTRCKRGCRPRFWKSIPRRDQNEELRVGEWVKVPIGESAGLPAEILAIDKSGRVSASLGNLKVVFHRDDVHNGVRASAKLSTDLLKAS